MTPQEQLEQAAAKYVNESDITMFENQDGLLISEHHFYQGGLKGMEIQKELDLHEIERLKECLSGFVRISHLPEYPEPIDPGHLGEAYAIHNAIESARKLIKP